MWIYIKDRPKLMLALLLCVWTLFNLVASFGAELSSDEAYLWYVAQRLDWGYIDTSFLDVFFAWLGLNLVGGTAFGLRLFFIVAQSAALYLFYDIVCRENEDSRSVWVYFLIALSIPLFQINGYAVTSYSILMLVVSFGIWAYVRFLETPNWLYTVVLGLSFALIGSVGFQGLILVLAILACNYRLLLSFRFYIVPLVFLVLLSPQIWWQYVNHWPVLDSHLALYDGYSLGAIFKGWAFVILRFNPLIVIPFLVIICRANRDMDDRSRLMRAMFWLFALLVLYTASRGITPALMVVPIAFSLLFTLVRSCQFNSVLRRYLTLASVFSLTIMVGLRLFVIIGTYGTNVVSEKARFLSDSLIRSNVRAVIFNDKPSLAALVDFYDTLPAYSMTSSRSKDSQYALRDISDQYLGQKVALELPHYAVLSISEDSLANYFVSLDLPDGGSKGYFKIIDSYQPANKVVIAPAVLPEKVLTDSRISITLNISNPYPYEIAVGSALNKYAIVMQLKDEPIGPFYDILLTFKDQTITPHGQVVVPATALIPNINTGFYNLSFTLRPFPEPSCSNSDVVKIQVINPKSRI